MPILTIARKEFIDTLRDRRTLLIMILVPFLLLPVLFSLLAAFTIGQKTAAMEQEIRLGWYAEEGQGQALLQRFQLREDLNLRTDIKPSAFSRLVREDSLDLAVIVPAGFEQGLRNNRTANLQLRYNSTKDDALLERVLATINGYSEELLQERLSAVGITEDYLKPVEVDRRNVYTKNESIGKTAGGMLPYFFVLFCLFGAMYPAIDLFAGEKERGTIETILSVPVTRLQLLTGKLLVIIAAGLLSGALTIAGLYLALQLNPDLPPEMRSVVNQFLSPGKIALVVLMMIPLAAFFAGLLVAASIYARSFKEAQSIIQPFTILAVIPMAMGFLPGMTLNEVTALMPVLNVSLATKEIMAGTLQWHLMALTLLSLLFFAGISVWIGSRWFRSEGNVLR